jgi:hypothetical protein
VLAVCPATADPFFHHWYVGEPPLVGVAVNVTVVPVHTGLPLAAMLTVGVTGAFTTILMMLLVAGLPVTQVALDVITTFTAFPLAGTKVYVGEFVPTGVVPTYHW